MFIALNRGTAGRGLTWSDFVKLAADTGYDGVDVELDAVRAMGGSAAVELLDRYGLRPAACGVPVEFRQDDAVFREGMATLEDYAQLALEIGCPRMATWVPPAWPTPAAEMRAILKARFSEMARPLADNGVKLGLEFITPRHFRDQGHPCVWQMRDMLNFCRECGSNVGLLLDSWHWHHDPDATVKDILDAGADRIVTVHLNDSPDLPPENIRDDQRLLPGEGVIDLKGFLNALQQVGYDGPLSLEIFGRLGGLAPESAAREALTAARSVLAAALSN